MPMNKIWIKLACTWILFSQVSASESLVNAEPPEDAKSNVTPEGISTQPKAIPETRSEIKKLLGALKERRPRLEIPDSVPGGSATTSNVINGRARRYYLPESWLKGERLGSETQSKVSYELKTQCFWIVSRGNNCHYCLGHQEHKLKLAGFSDDQLGALDRDWESLQPRERLAVELARKMTLLPFAMSDQDTAKLKNHFSDEEIIDLVYSIARFNSMNRWTDSMGLPQDQQMRGEDVEFDSPTDSKWDTGSSVVTANESIVRPEAWDWDESISQLQASRTRSPRVELLGRDQASELMQIALVDVEPWHRVLASLPGAGPELVKAWTDMLDDPELASEIKLSLWWTTARYNRAAASLAMAYKLATKRGISEKLMMDWTKESSEPGSDKVEGSQVAIAFAKKLTCHPQQITDEDIGLLRKHFSDRQAAQLIYTVAVCNAVDRWTETLGVPGP